MRYCKRCLYPENHPLNITFDEEGVCSGCRIHEEKDRLNWDERKQKLAKIFDAYRDRSGRNFDCIVPVSGGRDSHYIMHVVVKEFGMNPLVVNYNHEYNTRRGIRNLANLLTVFDCDQLQYTLDPALIRKLTRYTFTKFGSMYWHVQAGCLTFPVQVAVKAKIPLIVWGVNGWSDQVGMFSHLDEVEMAKKVRKEHSLMCRDAESIIDEEAGITKRDVQPFIYPFDNELEMVGVKGIYLSNYIRWDSKKQHEQMIKLYGYESAEQERTFNTYEDVECLHSAGTHDYIKFLKYGYGKVTDHASREIRLKRMTREEGIAMVAKYERVIPRDLPVFLDWLGLSYRDFYETVDRFRDPAIWHRGSEDWKLLDSVVNHSNDDGVDAVRLPKEDDCKFMVTPSREPDVAEDRHILMGRGYLDKYNFKAIAD